jgi:hypothetical protein
MSITAEEQLHGVAILRLTEELGKSLPGLAVRLQRGTSRSAYIFSITDVSDTTHLRQVSLVLYLKTSRKRRTPWKFVFHRAHQEELETLSANYGNVYLGFICGDDGIATIDFKTLRFMLDEKFEDQEVVTVRRNPGEMYRLSGSDGALKNAVSRSGFPIDVVDTLRSAFA